MTKKDYIIIAKVLRRFMKSVSKWTMYNKDDQDAIIDEFAREFMIDNKRFDYKRFKESIIK